MRLFKSALAPQNSSVIFKTDIQNKSNNSSPRHLVMEFNYYHKSLMISFPFEYT